jgi:predicted nucleotidyltransferase component of viral defense system
MDKVVNLSPAELDELFSETSAIKGISKPIVEKDFWVTWVLCKIFTHEELSNILMFKGGTSLLKIFNIIERFSEDIDQYLIGIQ